MPTPVPAPRPASARLAGGRLWNALFIAALLGTTSAVLYACGGLVAVVLWLG